MDFLLDKWKKGRVWWKVDQTCHPFFLPLPPSLFFATMCRLQCATGIRNRQGYSRRRGLKFLLWKFDYLLFFVFYFCLNDASLFPGSRTDCGVASRFYQNGTERNSICFLFLVTFSRRPMRFPIQRAHLLLPILPVSFSFSFFLFLKKEIINVTLISDAFFPPPWLASRIGRFVLYGYKMKQRSMRSCKKRRWQLCSQSIMPLSLSQTILVHCVI